MRTAPALSLLLPLLVMTASCSPEKVAEKTLANNASAGEAPIIAEGLETVDIPQEAKAVPTPGNSDITDLDAARPWPAR